MISENIYAFLAPIAAILIIIYYIIGLWVLIENGSETECSSLWTYNLFSYMLVFFTTIYFFVNLCIYEKYKKSYIKFILSINILIYFIYLTLLISGIVNIINMGSCSQDTDILKTFGIINLIIQLLIFFIINWFIVSIVFIYKNSKIIPLNNHNTLDIVRISNV